MKNCFGVKELRNTEVGKRKNIKGKIRKIKKKMSK